MNSTKIFVEKYISEHLDKLPFGVVIKECGVGATSLELRSKRHSIITVPTIALARCKTVGKPKYFNFKSNTKLSNLEAYAERVEHLKIAVVYNSLDKLTHLISKSDSILKKINDQMFLAVDEIDQMQTEAGYRDLNSVVDISKYYVTKEQVCFMTSTYEEFSDEYFKNLKVYHVSRHVPIIRDVEVFTTEIINKTVLVEISKLLDDDIPICIFYNSLKDINHLIGKIDVVEKDISVYCSTNSKSKAGGYYSNDLNKLSKINFFTKSYFAGVDILDECYLITVTDVNKPYTLLLGSYIEQIHGRFRNGVLSDIFIHNYNPRLKSNIKNYKESLITTGNEIIDNINALELTRPTGKLAIIDAVVKSFNDGNVNYIRKDSENKLCINYLAIDNAYLKELYTTTLYTTDTGIISFFNKNKHETTHNVIFYTDFDKFIETIKKCTSNPKVKKLLFSTLKNNIDWYNKIMIIYKNKGFNEYITSLLDTFTNLIKKYDNTNAVYDLILNTTEIALAKIQDDNLAIKLLLPETVDNIIQTIPINNEKRYTATELVTIVKNSFNIEISNRKVIKFLSKFYSVCKYTSRGATYYTLLK